MKNYDHKAIEKKWQKYWSKNKIYTTPDKAPGKDNFFLLVEFPYPSGNLHVGHWYAFAVPDILARAKRMQGKNVLYPIGFDAFGLPAENAAIKNGLNPRIWTEKNIAYMTKQIESMGASFDWSRKVSTIDPGYYRWTQWLFLQLFKNGLAYQKETAVNWCPKDKTVLANEQVVDGKCERCGSEVVQKEMLQWNVKITDYADRLVDDLEKLDWPEPIKDAQRAWIGRSEGAEIDFPLDSGKAHIRVFTTRADTLFGATYLVLAPEHPWVKLAVDDNRGVLENKEEVRTYIAKAMKKTELERQTDQKEKTGVELKGVKAVNPATGVDIPLWVSDYVLGHYGTGAVMGVPAHDERDFSFAKKFGLEIKEVIEPLIVQRTGPDTYRKEAAIIERQAVIALVKHWEEEKYLCLRYKPHELNYFVCGGIENGEGAVAAGVREIREETGYTSARFVRQLGSAIHSHFYHPGKDRNLNTAFQPLLFQLENGSREEVSEREKSLHDVEWVAAGEVAKFLNREDAALAWRRLCGEAYYTGDGVLLGSGEFTGMPSAEAKGAIAQKYGRLVKQYRLRDWIVSRQRYWGVPIPIIHCPKCGAVPVPDKELPVELPKVKDYLPEGEGKSPLAKAKKWVSVKCPNCKGKAERETDTLDTFVDSSWYFLRYTDSKNKKKFADAKKMGQWMPVDLYSGGAEHTTMHVLYSRFWQKALYDMKLVKDVEPYARRMNRSIILGPDGQKMSKSRGNVIDPDAVVKQLGADTVRMYLAFIGPYNEVSNYPWNPDGVVGVRRFLERVWRLNEKVQKEDVEALQAPLHKTIKKIGEDIEALKFNTAIAQLMIFLNAAEKEAAIGKSQWDVFLRLIAPFAPHIAEELWSAGKHKGSIHREKWPEYDEKFLKEDTVMIAIQVDGKTRGEAQVATDASKEEMERTARAAVASRLEGAEIARVVIVPGRLVNFVLKK